MLIIYTKSTCPFCHKVIGFLNDRGIDFKERDVYESEHYMEELLQSGGKRQIPYLVDTERGIVMYESDDIIQYVQDTYGDNPNVGV